MWQEERNNPPYYAPPPVVTHHTANNLTDGVIVPGLQALITAVLTGFAAGALAAWVGAPYWGVGFTAAALAALASWLSYRARWAFVMERILGVDLNQDGVIGQPEPEPPPARAEPVRIEIIQEGGRAGDFIELPARPEQLRMLADGLQGGRAFSQSVWTGNSGIFTRSEFEALRAELLRRGLAKWRKEGAPGQGIELTPPGRAVMRRFASETKRLSPPPPEERRHD